MTWLHDLLNNIVNFFKDFLLYMLQWAWQHVLDAIQAAVAVVPVPDAFAQFSVNAGSIVGSVVWFLTLLQFQYGVTVVLGAMAARFLLKFIPLLGF